MVSRKFRVRKKRYGKNNKGATFIHNGMMGLVRKCEAEKMARENAKKNSLKRSEVDVLKRGLKEARDEVTALRKASKQKAGSTQAQEEKRKPGSHGCDSTVCCEKHAYGTQ